MGGKHSKAKKGKQKENQPLSPNVQVPPGVDPAKYQQQVQQQQQQIQQQARQVALQHAQAAEQQALKGGATPQQAQQAAAAVLAKAQIQSVSLSGAPPPEPPKPQPSTAPTAAQNIMLRPIATGVKNVFLDVGASRRRVIQYNVVRHPNGKHTLSDEYALTKIRNML
eukprot:tig00000823_g4543.t1